MIKITTTTLDFSTGYLTATAQVQVPGADPVTLYPSFAEADLLKLATAAGRSDYTSADIVTAIANAIGQPELATPPVPETQPAS